MDKALEAAIRELYTAALCEERGKLLRQRNRRIAKRFLTEEQRIVATDEARIKGAAV